MKTTTILSPWRYRDGRRLNCGPSMSWELEGEESASILSTSIIRWNVLCTKRYRLHFAFHRLA